MAEYPKYFVRSGRLKKATSKRQEVELKFAGFREVSEGDVVGLTLDHADPVTAAVLEEATTQKAPPKLTEAEMAKLPEAADAEVVDLTVDEQSNTAPGGPPRPTRSPKNN